MENAIARKLEPPILNPIEIEGILLNRLLSISQKTFAEMRGVSESTISRRKSEGYYAEMAKEIAALGLQVVPPEAVVVSRHYLQSVETLAGYRFTCGAVPSWSAWVGLMKSKKGESRGAVTPTAFWCKNEEVIAR